MAILTAIVLFVATALPFAFAYIFLDFSFFSYIDWIGLCWISVLLILNLALFVLPISNKSEAAFKVQDRSGYFGLAPALAVGLLLYSTASILLILYNFEGEPRFLSSSEVVLVQLVILFIFMVFLWAISISSAIENRQSKDDVIDPTKLSLQLTKCTDALISSNGVSDADLVVVDLRNISDRLLYHVDRSRNYLASTEYKCIIQDVNDLVTSASNLSDSDTSSIKAQARQLLKQV